MSIAAPGSTHPNEKVPPLQQGDRLTREEFERRLEAMPGDFRAELIDGRVYMPPPVLEEHHGSPHMALNTVIGLYWSATQGVIAADNSSLRLDLGNLPQPDIYLRVLESHGGRSHRSPEGYIEGAPELIAEVAASRVSYDLHDKLEAYLRNGVNEYIVWRTYDNILHWFVLRGARYEAMPAGVDGVLRSETFPGLWLHPAALLRFDLMAVLKVLNQGLASPEHERFVAKLASAAK